MTACALTPCRSLLRADPGERLDLRYPAPKAARPAQLRRFAEPRFTFAIELGVHAIPRLREREQRGGTVVLPAERGRRVERGEQVLLRDLVLAEQRRKFARI